MRSARFSVVAVPFDLQVELPGVVCLSHQLPVYSARVNTADVEVMLDAVNVIGSISGARKRRLPHVLVLKIAMSYILVLSML